MHTRSMLVMAALAVLVAACDPAGPGTDPSTSTCRPTVGDDLVHVGSLVPLLGVPAGTTTLSATYGTEELPVAELDGGGFALLAPFADGQDPYRNGAVLVDLSADGQPCHGVTLHVEGLPHPDEPGVRGRFSATVGDLVQDLDTLQVQRSESGAHLDDLTAYLEFLLRSPDNPNALTQVLASGTMRIDDEVVALDFDLLDALLAHGAAAASAAAAASTGNRLAPNHAPQVAPASAWRTLRDAVRQASTPTGLAGLMEAQHDAEHVQRPAVVLTAASVAAAGALASVWLPVISKPVSVAAITITLSQVVLVETQIAYLPNDLTMTFDIDTPDLDEDGEGRWSNLQLHPSNLGSPDVIRAAVASVLFYVGRQTDPSNRLLTRILELVAAATDATLEFLDIDSVSIDLVDWAPVPIPVADAALWTNPYAEGVIEHPPTPPTYGPTTTGAGHVGLRLEPKLFQHRDVHARRDVFVRTIQVIVSPENPVLTPGQSVDFQAIVLHATDERVVWTTSVGIIRVDLPVLTWTAPDAATLADDCADANSVSFEVRAETLSLTGARQPKHDPPLRYGVAAVEVLCDDDDLTGTWSGTWYSSASGGVGPMTWWITQTGASLSGTESDPQGGCGASQRQLSGTLSESGIVTVQTTAGGHVVHYSAQLTGEHRLAGSWRVAGGTCDGIRGTFSLQRQ